MKMSRGMNCKDRGNPELKHHSCRHGNGRERFANYVYEMYNLISLCFQKTIYGANVVIFEGILAFANKELLQVSIGGIGCFAFYSHTKTSSVSTLILWNPSDH